MANSMTWRQVVDYCKEVFNDNPEFRDDYVAKREFFNNYTDMLCKDGVITSKQYETWSNPF